MQQRYAADIACSTLILFGSYKASASNHFTLTLDCTKFNLIMYLKNEQWVETPPVQAVIGFPVTALSLDDHVSMIIQWAKHRLSKITCVANVHMLIEAKSDPVLASVLHHADLVTPDGMPLVWTMRLTGAPSQERVAGMDLLLGLCQQASQQQISLFFLGSEPEILERIRARLEQEFPKLQIAGLSLINHG